MKMIASPKEKKADANETLCHPTHWTLSGSLALAH